MRLELAAEAELTRAAAEAARRLKSAEAAPLLVGLRGPLGSGKTTWVRAMLRALGYAGRVPSPTYTLLEEYEAQGITVVHADLYRIADPEEVEFLGLRDRFDAPRAWLLVEWPERAPAVLARADLVFDFALAGESGRIVTVTAQSAAGSAAVAALADLSEQHFN